MSDDGQSVDRTPADNRGASNREPAREPAREPDRQIDELERAGKLAKAREFAIAAARTAAADGELFRSARLLSKASEMALYTQGAESAAKLAREACELAPVERGAASDQRGDDVRSAAAVEARLALARVHLRIHTDSALDDAQAALDQIVDCGADNHRASHLKLSGLVCARRGRPREALGYFEEAYRRAEGFPALRARVLLTRAVQLRNWGLFDDAQRFAERSLEIRLQLGDLYGAAMCYGTLAFIYQRQGLWERERDALVADLRLCERIGGTADMPGLHARLAGALIGMGKYAGAWAEARTAIALENRRIGRGADVAGPVRDAPRRVDIDGEASGLDVPVDNDVDDDVDVATATRVHAFAWRELARVCLAQGRLALGLRLVTRAFSTFEHLRDGYGQALCQLTEAHLAHAQARAAKQAGDDEAMIGACRRVAAAVDASQPTFVRLGAVPEAAESIILHVESEHLSGRGDAAADMLAQQVLPMLRRAGLGNSPLFRLARETLQRIAPARAIARTVTRAAMLRSLAATMTEREPQMGTVVVALVDGQAEARAFALSAIDHGGVMLWPDSRCALAVMLGADHEGRARTLAAAHAQLRPHLKSGLIDLEHMWPAGVRARGEPIEAALAAIRRD